MRYRIRQWIGYLIMLAGVAFLCGPFIIGARDTQIQNKVVSGFMQEVSNHQQSQSELPSSSISAESSEDSSLEISEESQEEVDEENSSEGLPESELFYGDGIKDDFFQDALAYNQSLVVNGQDGMKVSTDVETFALDARKYGYTENVIGTIRIPRINLYLGLYMGAGYENMAKGGAIFGMTSLPLGMPNENVCIAGHRGWNGTTMFREIQKIQLNDPIYIQTPWRTLVYRVKEFEIVDPDDNTWCKIKPGKTMISIMTCHPYAVNTHRYIVYAELMEETMPEEAEILRINEETFDPNPREVTMVSLNGTREIVEVEPVSIQADGSEYDGAIWSNMIILAEDKMRPVAMGAAIVVGLIGIWLFIQTIRDIHRGRNEKHGTKGKNGTDY